MSTAELAEPACAACVRGRCAPGAAFAPQAGHGSAVFLPEGGRLAACRDACHRSGAMKPRAVVYVLAKAPRPGLVKTRLCPPLVPAEASRLAEAFLADTLARLAGHGGVDLRLALDSGPAGGGEGEGPRAGLRVESQGGGSLGERMARLLARGLETRLPTLLVGSDCPDLPLSRIDEACAALSRADAVLAPARDGGYVLVGARRDVPELFEIDAPWGSERVFAATCDALARSGRTLAVLEAWEDVDDAAALGRLACRLRDGGRAAAPATARLLDEWRREGVRF